MYKTIKQVYLIYVQYVFIKSDSYQYEGQM
jgi:hypothetical protein